MQSRTYHIIVMAIFIAINVALGFLLISIPNVELVTASIFLAGYLMGSIKGMVIGMITEFLYSMLNPFGIASPPLLVAQVISMGVTGYSGGIIHKTISKTKHSVLSILQLAAAGFTLTLLFDFLTTVSFAIFMAETSKKIIVSILGSFAYGLPFYITHIVVNTFIFATLLPIVIKTLTKIDYFKQDANTP